MRELEYLRVVIDEPNSCPYLPNQIARMPLCIPVAGLTPSQVDELLETGYRRSGWFYYRTRCPNCSACEPLRIDVSKFDPSRSQRRALKLGDRQLEFVWQAPRVDEARVGLFNKHKRIRGLDHGNPSITVADYQSFLLNASCDVLELALFHEGRLVAISITDAGSRSLSAVYCFFDPDAARLGLGTYAILKQVELARHIAGDSDEPFWLYLGLYVEQNSHLNYKAKFMPHERRIAGQWLAFSRDTSRA